jgi:hypothetical protein
MKENVFLALLSFWSLASFACGIQMDVTQKMDRDGNARLEVVFPVSSDTVEESGTCEKFYSNTLWKNPYCSVDGGKAIMRGAVSLKNEQEYVVKRSVPYNTYTYDAKAIHRISPELNGSEIALVLEMPGEIIGAEAGTLRANKVEIRTLDLAGRKNAYVESRELNTSWIIGLVSFIPIMLFVTYVAGRKQKKRDY